MPRPPMTQKILWLVQSNQVTPAIYDFFKLLQIRMEQLLTVSFIIPETSDELLTRLDQLSPSCVKVKTRSATTSYPGYLAKKERLGQMRFSEGLALFDVLLLDDLGGGNVIQTILDIEPEPGICGLFLQIPNPLGSSEAEERVFHAAVMWARHHGIPCIGYELQPLDIRWSLAATLPDAVITRTRESYDHMETILDKKNIWLLPTYEAAMFSPLSDTFNLNGIKAAYHFRSVHKIPETRTILYLPHNVAMIYEYQELLRILAPMGRQIHLMLSHGEDQVRGSYTQQEMIEMVYASELSRFASYSFHKTDSPWEMLMADSVVACSSCYQTVIAQGKNLLSLIYDPMLPPASSGFKQRVDTPGQLKKALGTVIREKSLKTEVGTIFMQVANSMRPND